MTQIETLMDTPIGSSQETVRDALSDSAAGLYQHLKERLRTRTLENEKLAAETLKLLEEVETECQERLQAAQKANLENERLGLESIEIRMKLVHTQIDLLEKLEPPAIAELNQMFLPGPAHVLRLPAPSEDEE